MDTIECIDIRLGPRFPKAHPELIGAFMQTASIDMGTAIVAKMIQDGLELLASANRPAQ